MRGLKFKSGGSSRGYPVKYKRRQVNSYLLKLDFEKTYDPVNWFFLSKTLSHLGFNKKNGKAELKIG